MSQPVQYATKNLAQVKVDPVRTLSRAVLFIGTACSFWLLGLLVQLLETFWKSPVGDFGPLLYMVFHYSLYFAFYVFFVLAIINLTRIQKPRPVYISGAIFFARLLTCVLIILSMLMSVGPNLVQWLVYTACMFIESLQPISNILLIIALSMPAIITLLMIIPMALLHRWKLREIGLKRGYIESNLLAVAAMACAAGPQIVMFCPSLVLLSDYFGVAFGIVCLWLISYCFRMRRFLNLQSRV